MLVDTKLFERKLDMIRKTLIAIATASTMALGMAALSAPANAYHGGVHISIGLGHGGVSLHNGHGHRHCHVRSVRVWRNHHWVWRNVRTCHSHRHHHGHH